MPWKETNTMKEKRSFIDAMLKQSKPFRELCQEYRIGEKTGYHWLTDVLTQNTYRCADTTHVLICTLHS